LSAMPSEPASRSHTKREHRKRNQTRRIAALATLFERVERHDETKTAPADRARRAQCGGRRTRERSDR
jgi:hypothetical protein